jgi:hypothetical protein
METTEIQNHSICILKYSGAISRVTVEFTEDVSEISSVSFIRVDVVKDEMSLLYVHKSINAMPHPAGAHMSRVYISAAHGHSPHGP